MRKPWENGDLYGTIHHFSWVNDHYFYGVMASSSQTVTVYRVKDRGDPENPQKTQGLMDVDPPK